MSFPAFSDLFATLIAAAAAAPEEIPTWKGDQTGLLRVKNANR